ncbi:GNAT family acetyltransferase [Niallia circulans]|jgi:GNAT superfamily N-acetyltransferase|uniref:GNAT family acetyltransferase n=1 Tax=Niallia circulans TaxID=1397 RepID=A0A0J1HM17_NIACI|nr:GNAT family N-acetyltransferase [Niallia circulans]KLV14754.1 GNAT family acetyltransferase [Niallia circulans]MED5103283.1 GNAT family N-acetyltransferase [Niallia circulans]NRG28304.1 GNAT family N-acetyltransferase [Niallia circulans]UQZ74299.1 N-acetyltransferase [Niallia circulans]
MEKFEVKYINNLLNFDLVSLVKQSKEDGFCFVERLLNEYQNGNNTFNHLGEGLFGVFNEEGLLVAIGGLNKDPFSGAQNIGRLRRFYVYKEYRRNGIGSLLVKRIIEEAKRHYKILVLYTDTEQADRFYSSIGFTRGNLYPNSSHFMEFKS